MLIASVASGEANELPPERVFTVPNIRIHRSSVP